MESDFTCTQCSTPLERDDSFCVNCGQTTAKISWSASSDTRPGEGLAVVLPGGTFYLVASNTGTDPVRVQVETAQLRGIRMADSPERQVSGHSAAAFALQHLPGEPVGGFVLLKSDDGPRPKPLTTAPKTPWWQVRAEKSQRLPVRKLAQIKEERWIIGSPAILFPPGVRKQFIQVWNDADAGRTFDSDFDTPAGYRITNYTNAIDKTPPALAAHGDMKLAIEAEPKQVADPEWIAGPDAETIPIRRMATAFGGAGAAAVVAIDFGTRNTGVRVRWRQGLVAGKPKGTVDIIGDRDGNPRFPTVMDIDLQGRSFRWGSEVPRGLPEPGMARVENLKTYLRVGENQYTKANPRWTNEYLLERYFERIFARLDAYFETADADTPLSRSDLEIRYVVTRPVLDANTGDAQGQRYQQALAAALRRCGVSEESVTFVHEPVAAAFGIARRRAGELFKLGEGAAVAVVDAGGGTTDIALARVRLRDGHATLDIRGSYALHLDALNPALPAVQRFGTRDRLEFGGDVLDYALTHRLLTDAADLLETEGRPVPPRLTMAVTPIADAENTRRENEFVPVCRTMKENFVHVSTHFISRSADQPLREYAIETSPNRPDYAGVTLEHFNVAEHLFAPILNRPIEELRGHMEQDGDEDQGIRPSDIKQVFYVGGTNIDFYVREQLQTAFPNSPRIMQETSEGVMERIMERLNAVVEGAVWYDEALFAASPLTLTLQTGETNRPLLLKGDPLPPDDAPKPHLLSVRLEPLEALEAVLIASGGELPEPVTVAQGFYRNTSDVLQEGTLMIRISREKGVAALLRINNRDYEQWQFLLAEAAR